MNPLIEILLFTLAAAALYFFSDWLLRRIEAYRGTSFKNRSMVFFVIILVTALIVFSLMQRLGEQIGMGGA